MKNLKISMCFMFLCMATFLLTLVSCSKDDAPTAPPDQQGTNDEAFHAGLFAKELPTLPGSLYSSDDEHVEDLADEFDETVDFMDNEFMEIPPGAEINHTPVTSGSGRYASTNRMTSTEYTVYRWGFMGYYFAGQFSEQNGMDVFELFVKTGEVYGYLKLIEIVQNHDGTHGTWKFWIGAMSPDILGPPDYSSPSTTSIWDINPDGSIFITEISYNIKIELLYNTDKSGNMKIYDDNQLVMEFTWDGSGHGTWTNYEIGASGSY